MHACSGVVAPVITEFPGITVGGAVMGGALESSSFRNGHFADALVALEVVLADGTVVRCTWRARVRALLRSALRCVTLRCV